VRLACDYSHEMTACLKRTRTQTYQCLSRAYASVPLPLCPEVTTKAVQSSWLPFSRARFTRALGQKGYATDRNRPSK
jgi:hypothetical protein